jgi:hypothetical protein
VDLEKSDAALQLGSGCLKRRGTHCGRCYRSAAASCSIVCGRAVWV